MKRIALGLLVLVGLLAIGVPASAQTDVPNKPDAYILDEPDVVSAQVESQINANLIDFTRRTTREIAVLIVDTTGDTALENYSIDVAREWGIGGAQDDNGVLMLIALNDRRARIEVGRGVEGDLTDLESNQVLQEQVFPRLREGDTDGAVVSGVDTLRSLLGDDQVAVPAPIQPSTQSTQSSWTDWMPLIIFGGLGLVTMASRFGGGGRGGRGRRGGGGPFIFYGGGGGWGGGSGGGGGFGGFGGGDFGGGGASGSW